MQAEIFTVLAVALAVLGIVRLLTTTDLVRRVIALNIASGGVLMTLLVLATRSDPPDAVPHALALTGIVITVSVTGLALVLIRRIETAEAGETAGTSDPDEVFGASEADQAAETTETAEAGETADTSDADQTVESDEQGGGR